MTIIIEIKGTIETQIEMSRKDRKIKSKSRKNRNQDKNRDKNRDKNKGKKERIKI